MSSVRLTLMLSLFASVAHAGRPESSRAGGLPACEARLDTCRDDLAQCDVDLNDYVDDCNTQVEVLQAALTEVSVAAPGRGAIVASGDGLVTATVSPVAVQAPTPITIRPVATPPDDRILSGVYDMGPDGQTFDDEVTICMTSSRILDSAQSDDLCLGYLDEDNRWVCEDACLDKTSDDKYCGTTDHFTNFALLLGGGDGGDACEDGDDWILPADGGVLSSASGAVTVRVPAGATASSAPVRFTIERLKPTGPDPRRLSDVYELGPDGATFELPVEICLDARVADPGDACLGYLDETGGRLSWVCEDECLEEREGKVCGQTSHFTSFAVLLNSGGGGGSCRDDGTRADPSDSTTATDASIGEASTPAEMSP